MVIIKQVMEPVYNVKIPKIALNVIQQGLFGVHNVKIKKILFYK